MRRYRSIFLFLGVLLLCSAADRARANGEILVVRAPEEVIGGDDITVLVTTTPRETDIDRTIVLDVPDSWTFVRAYGVESGSDVAIGILRFGDIQSRFTARPGRTVFALADTSTEFDAEAAGVAYFIVFSTKPVPGQAAAQPTVVKAALVERINPDSPPEIDKKTKRPKERNVEWRMVYPPRVDWSFDQITGRRVSQNIQLIRVARSSRALIAKRGTAPAAELRIPPTAIGSFFSGPFSLSFWARTTNPSQRFITFASDDGTEIYLGTSLLGTATLSARENSNVKTLLNNRAILVGDGAWHHFALSQDSIGILRLFVDAQPPVITGKTDFFTSRDRLVLGDLHGRNDFSLDELRFIRTSFRQPSDFERTIATAARDTSQALAALFHFDDFGNIARSSVPFQIKAMQGLSQYVPAYWLIDSNAAIGETTSPVQLDAVLLSADMISPTKVSIGWRAASEVGIKNYVLERRVGTYGAFEKVLTVEAKHGVKVPRRGASLITRSTYSVSEDLPKLNGDIELFYRLGSVGFSEKGDATYSESIKLEYGGDREVFVEQNDPNPFNPITKIAFRTTRPTSVRLSIFDIIGREVALLFNGKAEVGRHVYTLDATNWPGGIYFYKVRTAKTTVTRKMVLAK
jgi:hypothetical protein